MFCVEKIFEGILKEKCEDKKTEEGKRKMTWLIERNNEWRNSETKKHANGYPAC